jgi:GST-like protein
MITLLSAPTPNGRKAFIMLEETGLPYRLKPVDLAKNEQFEPDFLKVSPNNKVPAIIDEDAEGGPLPLFESGAILTYLADKSGKLLAPSGHARYRAMAWTYWQTGGLGPMTGQLGYYAGRAPEKFPPVIERFTEEVARLLRVLEGRLAEAPYLAGDDYSIADIANYPWTSAAANFVRPMAPKIWGDYPSIDRWLGVLGDRPAVQRAMATPPPTGST